MWILTELRCSFEVSGAMFTFMNPVENYIKEIRVPCKLEPSERATTTLPFVFESRPSSRVHSAHSPEMMSSSSTFLHPFARRQEIPAVKKQLHREIVYFFGCNKEVCHVRILHSTIKGEKKIYGRTRAYWIFFVCCVVVVVFFWGGDGGGSP